MGFYKKVEYAALTGAQPLVPVEAYKDVSIGVTAGASDDVDIVVQFAENGDRFTTSATAISSNVAKTAVGPVYAVGVDINTNVSTDVSIEVIAAFRGG